MPDLKAPSGIVWSYDLKGEGEPLLFIHGWGCNKNVWAQQREYFSRSYRVMAVDLPGHGESSWKKVSLSDMAKDLHWLTLRLGFKRFDIIASSLGGLIALKLDSLHPKIIQRLVLVGALPRFTPTKDFPYGLEPDRIKTLSEQLETDYPAIVQIFFRSLFTGLERRSERYKWLQQFSPKEEAPQKEALQEYLKFLGNEDLREFFRNINRPVQFVNGSNDYICSAPAAHALQNMIKGSRLEIFKECGHFPFLTKPNEFNEVVEKFLKETHAP